MALNPGIVETVAWLNKKGWPTCDSGDGESHDHTCDRDHAYVVIQLPGHRARHVTQEANALREALEEAGVHVRGWTPDGLPKGAVVVEANYSPVDKYAFINISGINDVLMRRSALREARLERRAAALGTQGHKGEQ